MTEEYQGWKNRETWAMALWLDNDQGLYEESRQIVRVAVEERNMLYDGADKLKDWVEELAADACECEGGKRSEELCNMFQDIGSLWRVDWEEVAESRFDEAELKKITHRKGI